MFYQDSGSETVRSIIQATESGEVRTVHKTTGKITEYSTSGHRVEIAGNVLEVARLVLGAHGELPEDGEIPDENDPDWTIEYADGNANNVHVSNLSWKKLVEVMVDSDYERPIVGIAKDGAISKYEGVAIAAKTLKLSAASIRKCLYGTQKRHGGLSWVPESLDPVTDEPGEVWKQRKWCREGHLWSSLGRRKTVFDDGAEKLVKPIVIERDSHDDYQSGDFWKTFYGDVPLFHRAIVTKRTTFPISKDMFTLLQTRCEFPGETWKILEPKWNVLAGGPDDHVHVSTRGRYKIIYNSGKTQMISSPIGMCLWEIFVGPIPEGYVLYSRTWELDVHSMFLHKKNSGSPYETRRSFNKHSRQWQDVYYR
jgi:hypothetical protein